MKVFDVFISYRRSDGEKTAGELNEYLQSKGIRTFFDKEKLEVGKKFPDQLRDAVRKAPHYVLIGTKDAFDFRAENKETGDLDFVKEEIRTALEVNEKNGGHTFAVLFTGGCEVPDRGKLPEDVRKLVNYHNVIEKDIGREAAFDKILKLVTEVTRVNLWYAAHRKLEVGKKPGGRFARLHIDESIMPAAKQHTKRADFRIDVKTEKDSDKTVPLTDAIKATNDDLYLIGEGGIGKTTALIKIMEEAYGEGKTYSENTQIPIFVELSFAPDRSGKWIESGRSTFILRSVYKQILDRRAEDQGAIDGVNRLEDIFGMDPSVAVTPIESLFTHETPAPEYILLLDGLNEVSRAKIKGTDDLTVIGLVIREIKDLCEKCPNVRIILTSRSDDSAISFENFTRYYLPGLDDEQIKNYLSDPERGLPAERVKAALENKDLMNTLRVPLFLTLYAGLKDVKDITTQGEILHGFFHERSENIYTAQDRLAAIGTNFSASESVAERTRLNADMQMFVIELILPQIGYDMGSNEAFSFKAKQLRESAVKIIKGKSITDECGEYGEDVFPIRGRLGTEKAPAETVEALRKAFYPEFPSNDQTENINKADKDASSAIVKCLAEEIGILYRISKDEYGFIHQHFRDYFAAVKYINVMKLAAYLADNDEKDAALDLTGRYLKDKPVGMQIRRFIGEISGEHHNRPYSENKAWKLPENAEKSLIMKTLDIYRGEDHNAAGYAVYSLIHILNEARDDLSGCDFSGLDFSGCNLNGMRLSRKGIPARFEKVVLNYDRLDFLGHTGYINSAAFSPDGKRIVTASSDDTAKIWDAESFELLGTIEGHSGCVNSASYSPDGKRIVTALWDGTAKKWDAESFDLLGTIEGHSDWVNSASYSPDGKRIVTASADNTAKIWNAESFELLGTIEGHSDRVNSASYSPDGKRIVTASWDGTAKIWDAESFELLGTIEGHFARVNSASYSTDGERIVTASLDGTVKIWDVESFDLLGTIKGHSESVNSASYSSDEKRIVTVSYDKTAKIWDAESFELLGTIEGHSSVVNSASYSPNCKRVIAASADKTAKMWDAESFELLGTLEGHSSGVNSASYSPDGERIVTASDDETAKIWDAESFELLGTIEGHSFYVLSASYSPDGKRVVTASKDKTAKIWDAESFEPLGTLEGHSSGVNSASYSPDGKRIVTASDNDTAKIWDAENFELLGTLEGHLGWLVSAPHSPDGKRIIASLDSEIASIWGDAESFEPLGTLEGHSGFINSASYSPDGKRIVTASRDGTVKIWDAETFECIETIENIPGLNFVGVDFTRLDPRSEFTKEEKEIIRRYGGII